ncbi:CRISPR system precrRNA processing endoribonuclease RAMP protein Cas6 [Faecalibacterium sp. AF28-13AC]|nr:CRISPR system precrRNA processing endoribonuclease RAMP protein Cas6 [Faecalibacterium sp. AF28-13AC]
MDPAHSSDPARTSSGRHQPWRFAAPRAVHHLCRQAIPGRVLRGEHPMIEQLQFSLRTAETPRLPSAWAYRIYGWLMSQLPADTAARLHEQGEHPLSQSLCFDAAAQTSVWTLNLLDEALAAQVRPLLAGCTTLKLHGAPLQMELLGSRSVENGLQLLLAAREDSASRTRLWFRTPCAFKQAGRYAIYPQEFLLLQSLVLHWNTAFPDCQLSDPDALDAILCGLRIRDYSLHTVSYPIKNTCIPGFVGSAVVEARLALPLLELWNALLSFAPYGGIGIKTTLGMGGVSVEPLVLPQKLR